jgi:hypothetical protein
LTVNNFFAAKPWVGFLVTTSGGVATISTHTGYNTTGISVSHAAGGLYAFTIPSHPSGTTTVNAATQGNFLVMLSPYSTSSANVTTYPTGYAGSSTQIYVYCRSSVGTTTTTDGSFYLHTVP